jgi:methyl-accepting chemotaxis protein
MQLTLRTKIILLPALAGVVGLLMLGAALVFGRRSQRELATLEQGHYAALEADRGAEADLQRLQRILQDAAAASDTAALSTADSAAAAMRQHLAAAKRNPTATAAQLDAAAAATAAYYATARPATARLIAAASGDTTVKQDSVMAAAQRMTAGYNALKDSLAAATHHQEARVREAFAAARAQQAAVAPVITVLLAVGLLGLALVSWWIIHSVMSGIRAVARAAEGIAEGDVEQVVEHRSQDELGALADAFRRTIAYVKEVAAAADALASGNLTVVVAPRSDRDVLARSMARATETLHRVATETQSLIDAARDGDMHRRGEAAAFEGAYAQLVGGMNAMLDAMTAPLTEAGTVLARVAARDLTVRVTGSYRGDHEQLQQSLNVALDNIVATLSDVAAAARRVADDADSITSGSEALAAGTSEQAGSLEEVSATLTELAGDARQSAQHGTQLNALTLRTRERAEAGRASMRRLAGAMSEIKTSAAATAKIVKTIDEIAFQTNLLALNAAVEAARAGDAGRGFAVVADEVRALAQRSAEAARSTQALIEESVRNAEQGVELNDDALAQFDQIAAQITEASGVVEQIAQATERQAEAITQITSATDQMNRVTQHAAQSAEMSAATAVDLSEQAGTLQDALATFVIDAESSESARAVEELLASTATSAARRGPSAGARRVKARR